MIIVDDRLLFVILTGTETTELALRAAGGIATTFSWYYRLSRAISTGRVDGSLTREFAALTDDRRTYVHRLLEDLPQHGRDRPSG